MVLPAIAPRSASEYPVLNILTLLFFLFKYEEDLFMASVRLKSSFEIDFCSFLGGFATKFIFIFVLPISHSCLSIALLLYKIKTMLFGNVFEESIIIVIKRVALNETIFTV